jgi:hypothetical protein
MTQKAPYDWQTSGGGGDVVRLIAVLARLDVDLVVASECVDQAGKWM